MGVSNELQLTEEGLTDFGKDVNPTVVGLGLPSFLKEYNLFLYNLDSGLKLSEDGSSNAW